MNTRETSKICHRLEKGIRREDDRDEERKEILVGRLEIMGGIGGIYMDTYKNISIKFFNF